MHISRKCTAPIGTMTILAAVFGLSTACRASTVVLDDFLRRYAHSAAAIQKHCTFATYEAERTQTDRNGVPSVHDTLTVLTRDDKFRAISRCTQSTQRDLPVGSVWVCGGNRKEYFSAIQLAGHAEFVFSAFGPDQYAVAKFRNQCLVAVAPFTIATTTIAELLSNGKYVATDAQQVSADGREAIKVEFKPHDTSVTTRSISITVLADSLYLLSFEVAFKQATLHGENRYEGTGDSAVLKRIETWSQAGVSPVRMKDQIIEIRQQKTEIVADDQFTPAAAGIKETPASISSPRD